MTAIASTQMEVSGLGIVDVFLNGSPFDMRRFKAMPPELDLTFRVKEVELLHIGSRAYTEISPDAARKYTASVLPQPVKLWWHRHPCLGWSARDEKTARHEPFGNEQGGPLVQWGLAIVWTPKGWIGRYDQWEPDFTLHIPVTVEGITPSQEQFEALAKPAPQTVNFSTVDFEPIEVLPGQLGLFEALENKEVIMEMVIDAFFTAGLSVDDDVMWNVADKAATLVVNSRYDMETALHKACREYDVRLKDAEEWADNVSMEVFDA